MFESKSIRKFGGKYMENKKKTGRLLPILLFVGIIVVVAIALMSSASAKSLYVNKDLNADSPISAYDIQGPPNYLVWQQTSIPTRYGGVDLTIDTDSEILFVTYEFSGTLDIVDAKTLNKLGQVTAPGASNLAGIVVDQENSKVYTVDRNTDKLYVYSWDAGTTSLTLDSVQNLPGIYAPGLHSAGLHGIALDEVNDLLYACDVTYTFKFFNTADWSLAGIKSISQKAMGIAVDVQNGFVYTGNAYVGYGGNGLLCKYDLNTNSETTVNVRTITGDSLDNVLGVAIDSATSLVYITTGNLGGWLGSDQIMVFDSNLNLLHQTGDIGNPTGIAIPGKDISYNPLNLAKVDDVPDGDCVRIGETYTYTLSYSNGNQFDVTGVTIIDTLPVELDYISNTGGGIYNSGTHKVTWNIGGLTAGESGSVTLTVKANSNAILGGQIDNAATINANEPNTGPTTKHEYTDVCMVTLVEIDIKPGSYPNSINPKSKGNVPVAILTTDDFDASNVDPATIVFLDAAPIQWAMDDVDFDGDLDMILHFKTQELDFELLVDEGDEYPYAYLTGETNDGQPMEGKDTVRLVGRLQMLLETIFVRLMQIFERIMQYFSE